MPDPAERLGDALAGRYRIERELGRGGMATVYLVQDLRHDRPVALKVLHPELAVTLGPERFQREIRLAARLQHPHILSVHDSGESSAGPGAPILWFTMPYVEGESLRQRLARETQLPVEDAVRIGREAAEALAYAHLQGVIHRDVKPENILLSAGHALVADFGIARALADAGDDRLTGTGTTLGTPAYMSPEQAAGERNVDARSDIYSLGCVVWEMLAGEPPFAAPTAHATIARRFTETPKLLRAVRETVPEPVERAVAKALARAPADRFATAGEMAKALEDAGARRGAATAERPAARRLSPERRFRAVTALAIGFLIGIGVLFGWLRRHGAESAPDSGPRRLAVLPFENLGEAKDEYFADGVTDEIRGKLASVTGLQVTARSSSGQYKRTTKSPREIGQELGVDYLLTGTVRWEKGAGGSRVRVSPELIRVSTASSQWQQPFDAALSDVFQVQADIAGRVAEALNLALEAPMQRELAERPTTSLPAYDAYLKGEDAAQGIWGVNPGELRRAAAYYEQAVALDSTFLLAWAQLSRALSYVNYIGNGSSADAERARIAAERAMALGPGRPEGRMARGDYLRNVQADNGRALAEYLDGLRVAPNDADLLTGASLSEQSLGRWDESVAQLKRSLEIDPRSVTTSRRLGFTYLWMRRYPEALAAVDRAAAVAPDQLQTVSTRAMIYVAQGDLAKAKAAIRQAAATTDPTLLVYFMATYWDLYWLLDDEQQALLLRLTPSAFDNDRATWGEVLAETYALRGDSTHARIYADSARIAFEEHLRDTPNDPQRHLLFGVALALMGRRDDAVRNGERGVSLNPIDRDAYTGAYTLHQLARIYIMAGRYDQAVGLLERLLGAPYFLSAGWLRVDPAFDPLRGNPRFEKLLREGA